MTDATVIIAAWNAADTIGRSVDSALAQQAVSVGVVVADDASDEDIASRLPKREEIIFHRLEENGGPGAARNAALDLASGDWACVLDSDDTMLPDRLAGMIAMAEELGADIILGNFLRVDGEGQPLDGVPFILPEGIDPEQPLTLEEYVADNLVSRSSRSAGYLKPLIRRAFLERTGLRYDPTLRNGEDCHLIFEALAMGAKVHIRPEADYLYTVREGSVSYRINPDHFEALIKADRAFTRRHDGHLSARASDLFRRRETGLRNMMNAERVLQALKSRRLPEAIRLAGQHPAALPRVGRQIVEGLGKRLRGEK
ncbi:glycosyltransferase family 2 protein [Ruegeria sp. 2205SS24-7]|uniref:glycosyltransferase family 2 protein n=1 Tax=Ruegeria discodermiae TaxID=3064389 RepID=UPI0027426A99|nr:glycosyltransferase family 2 protein [Ruegeria sp. 2205SS24-7]MDP5220855.1 glycosyltransferase family 2 protein [Ruegeria sp. 2205SS24-7]